MALKWIGTSWEDDLKTRVSPTERIYIDFKQEIYPPISGSFHTDVVRVNIVEGILVGDLTSSTNPGTAT